MLREGLINEVNELLSGFWLTDLANFSSFFFEYSPRINWIGFYLYDGEKLRLGPFAGKPACTEIAVGQGVCGTSFEKQKAMLVEDVHQFKDHISCDPVSQSELVLPFYVKGQLVGVLDIDSPEVGRFTEDELKFFENALDRLSKKISSWGFRTYTGQPELPDL